MCSEHLAVAINHLGENRYGEYPASRASLSWRTSMLCRGPPPAASTRFMDGQPFIVSRFAACGARGTGARHGGYFFFGCENLRRMPMRITEYYLTRSQAPFLSSMFVDVYLRAAKSGTQRPGVACEGLLPPIWKKIMRFDREPHRPRYGISATTILEKGRPPRRWDKAVFTERSPRISSFIPRRADNDVVENLRDDATSIGLSCPASMRCFRDDGAVRSARSGRRIQVCSVITRATSNDGNPVRCEFLLWTIWRGDAHYAPLILNICCTRRRGP